MRDIRTLVENAKTPRNLLVRGEPFPIRVGDIFEAKLRAKWRKIRVKEVIFTRHTTTFRVERVEDAKS